MPPATRGSRRRSLLRLPGRRLSLPVDAGLSIDAAYSRQFVKEVPLKTVNQDRLGGGRLDGKATSKGQVFQPVRDLDF